MSSRSSRAADAIGAASTVKATAPRIDFRLRFILIFASSVSFECMGTEQIRSERSGQVLFGESAEILHRRYRKIQTPGVSPASPQKKDRGAPSRTGSSISIGPMALETLQIDCPRNSPTTR